MKTNEIPRTKPILEGYYLAVTVRGVRILSEWYPVPEDAERGRKRRAKAEQAEVLFFDGVKLGRLTNGMSGT
jgi:hypothetical protein